MKKVVDWTFGSIFRTFGRIIAYVIFGIAISYLLSSLDFRITDLFLDNVKADTLNTFDTGGWANWPWDSVLTEYSRAGLSNPEYINGAYYTPNNTISNITGINKIQISGYFQGLDFENNNEIDRFQCTSSYNGVCNEYTLSRAGVQQFTFQIWTNNHITQCQLDWNMVNVGQTNYYNKVFWVATCNASVLNNISLYVDLWNSDYSGTFNIGINRYVKYWRSDSSAIIENQNQNTQTIVEQQQNATQQILDDNTTQAESEIEGFFGDFDVPDVGGLSGIITAPLNTIRSLLSSSCSELVLPLPYVDDDLRLPCMNSIYTEHFGLFFSLYQTIILAIIAYRCIRSIYFDITGFTNPDDDRIEVMDL